MNQSFLTTKSTTISKNSELYMTFSLSDKVYTLPAEKIIEIVQLPALTYLEKLPDQILGLLNLRGQVISIIDLAYILGLHQKSYDTDSQILIVNSQEKTFGIIVDSVNDVIQFDKNHLEPLPYKSKDKIVSSLYKTQEELVAFLDCEAITNTIKLLETDEINVNLSEETIHKRLPSDPASLEKLKRRAAKLQKELRIVTDDINYHDNYFVSFSLNQENYCINLKYVKEITKLKLVNLTPVPCVPDYIIGIINSRGDFITIVDIKHFLQIQKSNLTEKTKIIVVKISNMQIGILVDEVFDIENIPNEKLTQKTQSKYDKNKLTSAEVIMPNKKVMSILDLRKLIEDERLYIEDAI